MSIEPAVEMTIATRTLRFSAKGWGRKGGLPVLALHGWLDNAASFDRLAPCLPDVNLVAVDMAGHGRSEHRPAGVRYHFIDYVDDVIGIANALEWKQFALLGHSMGAGVSSVVAGSFPERITHLLLLEGIGPMTREADKAVAAVALSVSQMQQFNGKKLPIYPDLESAVSARIRVGDMHPASVEILVRRSLVEVAGGLMWRSDPRLKMGSALYLVEEQVLAFLRSIKAPSLLITGRNGLLLHLDKLKERSAAIPHLKQVTLEGGHHLHLDDPEPAARAIEAFLRDNR